MLVNICGIATYGVILVEQFFSKLATSKSMAERMLARLVTFVLSFGVAFSALDTVQMVGLLASI